MLSPAWLLGALGRGPLPRWPQGLNFSDESETGTLLGKSGQATSAVRYALLGVSHFQESAPPTAAANGDPCRRQRRP